MDLLRTELKSLNSQREQLEALYTQDHPEVIAVKRKIANVRAEIAAATSEPAKGKTTVEATDSPQLAQLKAQLHAAQQSVTIAKAQQARIEAQVRKYEERIESSPMVEEEYKQITRDHETALQFYNALLTKMNESSMATALEHRQQGEQFRVMDAPNLPDSPTFPKRSLFAGGGLGAGLMLGLILAAILEYRDTSLRSERDVWAFTKLPTLALVPFIDDLPKSRWTPKRGLFSFRKSKPVESSNG